jgi:hypothetical protein
MSDYTIEGTADYANSDGREVPNWLYVNLDEPVPIWTKHGDQRWIDRVAIACQRVGHSVSRGDVQACNRKGIPVTDYRWRVGEFKPKSHSEVEAHTNGYGTPDLDARWQDFLMSWIEDKRVQIQKEYKKAPEERA